MAENTRHALCLIFPAIGNKRLGGGHLKDHPILQATRGELMPPCATGVEADEIGRHVQAQRGPVAGENGHVGK